MKILGNRSKVSTVALVLVLTVAAFMASMPAVNAHDPAWSIPTFTLISVAPSTVGVGQQALIYMWLSIQPPTALGAYGDRWKDFEVEVTDPDGNIETLGPFTSDPIGFAWTAYTPDEAGTYTLQASFPGQTLVGENLDPSDPTGQEFIGDYFEPSTSDVVSLTVQQDPIEEYPTTPLPTDYWERPIDAQHRDWWSFSGNWLTNSPNMFAPYTEGPETAHILWTKELAMGGLVGGEFEATSYHCGNAYEGKWTPPVIINGRLYYNLYQDDFFYGMPAFGKWVAYPGDPPKPGFVCVDLRTGEELWRNYEDRIFFGQIYRYDTFNQHGAFAYLWSINLTTWKAYDAYTGHWVYTVENVPLDVLGHYYFRAPANMKFGPDGSIFVYVLDTVNHRLALWNSSAIPELRGAPFGTRAGMWRPYGKVVDGRNGSSWNVTIPADLEGSINRVLDDRIIGSTGLGAIGFWNLPTENYTVWALSLKPGEEGKLLWKRTHTAPTEGTFTMGASSLEDGVFTVWSAQTRQHWGYSLDNGNLLWGPTESQAAWDFAWDTKYYIADGKLFSGGYGGELSCYNVTTGKLLWTYDLECPNYLESKWGSNYIIDEMIIADGKVYLFSGEHSPDDPKERGAPLACVDVENGEELWSIPFYSTHWSRNPAIADGIIVYQNIYDNRIYTFGKGQTATTVSGPETVVPLGTSVLIKGTVTDQSPGAKDTPAIADEHMTEWMKYLYMQFPIPGDATGVEVTLDTIDPNGNFIHIDTVTSDMSGTFSYMWTPEVPGKYTIIATFMGSESYWSSYAETAIGVGPAPEAPPEPEEAPAYTAIDLAIIAAVVAVAILVIYDIVSVRKLRK